MELSVKISWISADFKHWTFVDYFIVLRAEKEAESLKFICKSSFSLLFACLKSSLLTVHFFACSSGTEFCFGQYGFKIKYFVSLIEDYFQLFCLRSACSNSFSKQVSWSTPDEFHKLEILPRSSFSYMLCINSLNYIKSSAKFFQTLKCSCFKSFYRLCSFFKLYRAKYWFHLSRLETFSC